MIRCCAVSFPSLLQWLLNVEDQMLLLVADPATISLHYLIKHYINIDFTCHGLS
jgi:hypothetical protein